GQRGRLRRYARPRPRFSGDPPGGRCHGIRRSARWRPGAGRNRRVTASPPPSEDPTWVRLLAAARRSLERTGGAMDGAVSLAAPSEAERVVVIGVTGTHRSAASGRLTVRLAELDAHLRAAYGIGLAEVVACAAPLRDRPGEAKREAVAR